LEKIPPAPAGRGCLFGDVKILTAMYAEPLWRVQTNTFNLSPA
jgi:hypothetical protein